MNAMRQRTRDSSRMSSQLDQSVNGLNVPLTKGMAGTPNSYVNEEYENEVRDMAEQLEISNSRGESAGKYDDPYHSSRGKKTANDELQSYIDDYAPADRVDGNKAMQDETYLMAKELEMKKMLMDYENAYNSPKSQMSRYDEAGLNPNLIYQKDNNSSSQTGPSHHQVQGQAETIEKFNTSMSAMKMINDIRFQQAEISGIEEENRLRRANALLTYRRANTEFFNTQNMQATVSKTWKEVQKLGAETFNEKIRGALLENEKNNIPIANAILKVGLKHNQLSIVFDVLNMYRTIAETKGISIQNAINQYTYDKLLPLQRTSAQLDNERKFFDLYMDETFESNERTFAGKSFFDRTFSSWKIGKGARDKVRKANRMGEYNFYIPSFEILYNQAKKDFFNY